MKFPCPHCGGRIGATQDWFGTSVPCPHCGKQILVPGPALTSNAKPPQSPAPSAAPEGLRILRFRLPRSALLFLTAALALVVTAWFFRPALASWSEQVGGPTFWKDLVTQLRSGWSPDQRALRVHSCRMVDTNLDEASRQELGLTNKNGKVLVVIRMGIPARYVIPSPKEYETMKRAGPPGQIYPAMEYCRWFDARKFTFVPANATIYEGLALCRLGQSNLFTGFSGSKWGTTIGEIAYFAVPGEAAKNRVEEVEVCFAVDKDALQFAPFRLGFAGCEWKVPF